MVSVAGLMASMLTGIQQVFQFIQEYTGLVSPGNNCNVRPWHLLEKNNGQGCMDRGAYNYSGASCAEIVVSGVCLFWIIWPSHSLLSCFQMVCQPLLFREKMNSRAKSGGNYHGASSGTMIPFSSGLCRHSIILSLLYIFFW